MRWKRLTTLDKVLMLLENCISDIFTYCNLNNSMVCRHCNTNRNTFSTSRLAELKKPSVADKVVRHLDVHEEVLGPTENLHPTHPIPVKRGSRTLENLLRLEDYTTSSSASFLYILTN